MKGDLMSLAPYEVSLSSSPFSSFLGLVNAASLKIAVVDWKKLFARLWFPSLLRLLGSKSSLIVGMSKTRRILH